jgi:hypothetical protein
MDSDQFFHLCGTTELWMELICTLSTTLCTKYNFKLIIYFIFGIQSNVQICSSAPIEGTFMSSAQNSFDMGKKVLNLFLY